MDVEAGTPDVMRLSADGRAIAPAVRSGLAPFEAVATVLFVLVASLPWSALTLAEFGILSRATLVPAWIAVAGAGLWLARDSISLASRRWSAASAGVMVVLLGFGAAVGPPAEYVADGTDGSIYVATGRMIVSGGSFNFEDPVVAEVPAQAGEVLFRRNRNWPQLRNRFPGGLQIADGSTRVLPNFFHLFPALFAAFEIVFGRGAGYYVNTVAALVGLSGLAVLGSRLWSPAAGVLAAALLAVQFIQLWFARFPASEMLAQMLILWGLCFMVTFVRSGTSGDGILASAAFGLAAFTRIDVLGLVIPIVALFLLVLAAHRGASRSWWVTAAALAAFTAHAVTHSFLTTAPYMHRILGAAYYWPGSRWLMLAGGMAATAALAASLLPAVRTRFVRLVVPFAYVLLGAVLLAVALRSQPGLWPKLTSWVGILCAFAGIALLLRRSWSPEIALAVALFLFAALLHTIMVPRTALLPFALRRYVPIVGPLSCAFIAYLAMALWRQGRWWRPVAVACVVLVAGISAARAMFLVRAPVYGITESMVGELAAKLPSDAIVIFDGAEIPSHVPLAVQYFGGREAIAVMRRADRNAVAAVAEVSLARGRPVWAVYRAGVATRMVLRSDLEPFHVTPRGTVHLQYTDVEQTRGRLPRKVVTNDVRLDLYSLGDATRAEVQPLPFRVDIGGADFAYVLDGFYPAEQMPSGSIRWMGPRAALSLPPLDLQPDSRAALRIRKAVYRPAGAPPMHVDVHVDDILVGTFDEPQPDFAVYEAPLGADALSRLRTGARLTLRSTTFVPADYGSDDRRSLGMAVDWIAVESR